MTEMREIIVNGRWPLLVPEHRVDAVDWSTWEVERLASMHEHLKRGMVLWDLGTEEGDLSALFALWVSGDGGGIVLCEPATAVWPNIRAVWEANAIPAPLAWWVGFVGGETVPANGNPQQLHAAERASRNVDGWPKCSLNEVRGGHAFRHLAQEQDTTPTVTIDDFADRQDLPVHAITMDIEGAELAALMGAAKSIGTYRPLIWISVHPDPLRDWYDATPQDVTDLLVGYGYKVEVLAVDHEIHVYAEPIA